MAIKEEGIELEGTVVEALKGKFRVETDIAEADAKNVQKHVVIAHLSGKLRKNNIRIVVGDRVRIEVSTYDITKGRITYRIK